MAGTLPGFDSPAVGFGQPWEMLEACHERVQRSLDLLGRLVAHIDSQGHDAQTRAAAADVLRYFDVAAPLHHEDEEVHVFPLLLSQGDAALRAAVQQLQADHRQMATLWAAVREALSRWCRPDCREKTGDADRAAIGAFRAIYGDHITTEEERVYPAARVRMDDAALTVMGREMQARRQG